MQIEWIAQVLKTESHTKEIEKGVYGFGEDSEVAAFFDMGHETLTISRIRRMSFLGECLLVETYKAERFYIAKETPMRGLKFAEPDGKKNRGAGFTSLG